MTNNAFLINVRRYAELAHRHRTSYRDVVRAMVEARARSVAGADATPEQYQAAYDEVFEIARAEYGVEDANFALTDDQIAERIQSLSTLS